MGREFNFFNFLGIPKLNFSYPYTNSNHKIMITCPILCCPPFANKTVFDSKSEGGLWYLLEDVSNRSLKSFKLWEGGFMDWICLPSTSHRTLIGLRSGKSRVKSTPQTSCCAPQTFCFVVQSIILLKEAKAIRECHISERVYRVCNNAWSSCYVSN